MKLHNMRTTLLTTIAVALIAQLAGALPITYNEGTDALASCKCYHSRLIKHLVNMLRTT